MYVGGDFTTIKNTARTRVARLNATNGNVVTAFTANTVGRVSEMRDRAERLPPARRWRDHDASTVSRRPAIASLDPTTGALQPWAATGIVPRVPTQGL